MTQPAEKKIEIILTEALLTNMSLVMSPGENGEPDTIKASAYFNLMQKDGSFYSSGSMGLNINVDMGILLKFWADCQNQVQQGQIGL